MENQDRKMTTIQRNRLKIQDYIGYSDSELQDF